MAGNRAIETIRLKTGRMNHRRRSGREKRRKISDILCLNAGSLSALFKGLVLIEVFGFVLLDIIKIREVGQAFVFLAASLLS